MMETPGNYNLSVSSIDVTTVVIAVIVILVVWSILVWIGKRLYNKVNERVEEIEMRAYTDIAKKKGIDFLKNFEENKKIEAIEGLKSSKTFKQMLKEAVQKEYFPELEEKKKD